MGPAAEFFRAGFFHLWERMYLAWVMMYNSGPERRENFVRRVLSVYLAFVGSAFLLGPVADKITFGNGSGDIVVWMLFAALSLGVVLLYLMVRRSRNGGWILLVFAIGLAVWLMLKITILRGAEYSWNGRIFYP